LYSGCPRHGLFSFHWTTEALKYEVPCPRPANRSFADPSSDMRKKGFIFMLAKHIKAILRGFSRGPSLFFTHLGSKLCILGATIRPKFASFILFIVLSFLLVIVFLFFSSFIFLLIHLSYSSLLISSYSSRTILPLLILLFLYLNCLLYCRHAY
jgi:hypothetical protein